MNPLSLPTAHDSRGGLWNFVLVLTAILLFVWQVPGTIGLRYGLLIILLILGVILNFRRQPRSVYLAHTVAPIIWLLLLTGWIALVIILWGVEPSLSWAEFRGQWLVSLGAGLIGILLARAALNESSDRVMTLIAVIFWTLLIQVLLHDVLDVLYALSTGEVPFRQAPVLYLPEISKALWQGQPFTAGFTGQSGDKFSYVNNTLAALVVAELVQRIMLKQRWLPIGWPVLVLSLAAVLACTYLLQFRNGNVGLLLLIGFAILMVLIRKARRWPLWKILSAAAVLLALLVSFGGALYKSDARWQTLMETAPIAWDTQTHQAWRKVSPYPELPNGQQVDASNYDRLAWAKEGAILILDHPLGAGYNRNAFGDCIDLKYAMNGAYRGGHSHSGLIDFAIANGIPGLLLWLSFLGALFYAGWCAFMRGKIAPGLALMFIVSGFFSRSIVDSNIRDHMLQQFMFLVMLFAFSLPGSQKTDAVQDD